MNNLTIIQYVAIVSVMIVVAKSTFFCVHLNAERQENTQSLKYTYVDVFHRQRECVLFQHNLSEFALTWLEMVYRYRPFGDFTIMTSYHGRFCDLENIRGDPHIDFLLVMMIGIYILAVVHSKRCEKGLDSNFF